MVALVRSSIKLLIKSLPSNSCSQLGHSIISSGTTFPDCIHISLGVLQIGQLVFALYTNIF